MRMNIEGDEIILDKVFRHLDRLWKETKKGDLSRYVLDMNYPESVKEVNAIYLLNEKGTVEIDRRETDSNVNHQIIYLKIDKDKVDEYFHKPTISTEYHTHFNLYLKQQKLYLKKQRVINKTIVKQRHKSPYYIDDLTFYLLKSNGRFGHIDFHPTGKSDNTDPFVLIEALVDELEENGKRSGVWIEVDVSRQTLSRRIIKLHPKYKNRLNEDWFKRTKGNLKLKTPKKLLPLIELHDYDRKNKSYKFRLKVPQNA